MNCDCCGGVTEMDSSYCDACRCELCDVCGRSAECRLTHDGIEIAICRGCRQIMRARAAEALCREVPALAQRRAATTGTDDAHRRVTVMIKDEEERGAAGGGSTLAIAQAQLDATLAATREQLDATLAAARAELDA